MHAALILTQATFFLYITAMVYTGSKNEVFLMLPVEFNFFFRLSGKNILNGPK